MFQNQHRRGFLLLAAAAILFAILMLMIPHGHAVGDPDLLAILPICFVGLISPLSLLAPLAYAYAGRTPDSPVLPASFQRPPPFPLA
jgi:hypothetical protein